MDISIYLNAPEFPATKKGTIGAACIQFKSDDGLEELQKGDIVLLGVPEYRNQSAEIPSGDLQAVRAAFYKMYPQDAETRFYDLGDILPGSTVDDTYHALSQVLEQVIKKQAVPVIIGGSHDLTWGQYKAYQNLEQVVNLCTVDKRYDIGQSAEDPIHHETFLSQIMLHQPNYLFDYTNLGWQRYYVSNDVLELMEQLNFNGMRLGQLRSNIELIEPLIRNADLVSVDLSSVQSGSTPACVESTPNGISADHICNIARYAGLSDKVSSFGVYGYHALKDNNTNTAELIAQIMWYFVEGLGNRKDDTPVDGDANYLRYRVSVSGNEEDLIFLKSVKTDRWWMKVPFPATRKNTYKRHQMVSCSYNDYTQACRNEIPELWLNTYRKFL